MSPLFRRTWSYAVNKKRKGLFRQKAELSCRESKMQETIQAAKNVFYEEEAKNILTKTEFLYQQSKYIRKRWWGIQGILLFLLWWILYHTGNDIYMQRSMGIAAPLFVILVIPEFWKNRCANAMEVECSAYYSLRQVYAARLLLFALTDIFLLTIFFFAAFFCGKITVAEFMIQFLVPFNITCCICFHILYSRKYGSEAFAILLCIIWAAIWLQIVLNEMVYQAISVPVWGVVFVLSLSYLCYCIQRGQKTCEETWEGNCLWN